MDDKLILSVFNFPELYNVTLPNYRCTETRINAWRSISTLMGVPSGQQRVVCTATRQHGARPDALNDARRFVVVGSRSSSGAAAAERRRVAEHSGRRSSGV
ncbi:hypothetical protein CRUP_035178 [Coryphaenoides rupestris]|nr:hypothetical protein CRUP_035178 [Coryphaenoides rupestris]